MSLSRSTVIAATSPGPQSCLAPPPWPGPVQCPGAGPGGGRRRWRGTACGRGHSRPSRGRSGRSSGSVSGEQGSPPADLSSISTSSPPIGAKMTVSSFCLKIWINQSSSQNKPCFGWNILAKSQAPVTRLMEAQKNIKHLVDGKNLLKAAPGLSSAHVLWYWQAR